MESPDIVASLQMFQQQRSKNKLASSFYLHKYTKLFYQIVFTLIKHNSNCLFFLRLFHTKRLRREIARLEKMEKEIAVKTTRIGEMATPEPKSRNCWTPLTDSGRIKKSKVPFAPRIIDKVLKTT